MKIDPETEISKIIDERVSDTTDALFLFVFRTFVLYNKTVKSFTQSNC